MKSNLFENLTLEVSNKWIQLGKQGEYTDKLAMVDKYFTINHRIAIQLDNMNTQVNNGGWDQWYANGCGGDLEELISYCKQGVLLKLKHFENVLEILSNIKDINNFRENKGQLNEICLACNGSGYLIEFNEEDDEYQAIDTCSECNGEGLRNIDITDQEAYYNLLLECSEEYYNINNKELIESFNLLIEKL